MNSEWFWEKDNGSKVNLRKKENIKGELLEMRLREKERISSALTMKIKDSGFIIRGFIIREGNSEFVIKIDGRNDNAS